MPTYTVTFTIPDAATATQIAKSFKNRYGNNYQATGAELVRQVLRDFIRDVALADMRQQAEAAALATVTPPDITVT